jgi:hypothetical protein
MLKNNAKSEYNFLPVEFLPPVCDIGSGYEEVLIAIKNGTTAANIASIIIKIIKNSIYNIILFYLFNLI